MKLSAVIIAKNEELILEKCLESLKGVDEIVVIDTGSTDDTMAIAQRHGAKVGYFPWCDDFSAARNWAIDQATGDWVLIIDADEVLQENGVQIIKEHIASCAEDSMPDGFYVAILSTYNYKSIRVMRPCVRYEGAIHETPRCGTRGQIPVAIHASSSPSHHTDPDRNLRVLSKSIEKSRFARNLYYLAKEYKHRQDLPNTIRLFEKYLKIAFWQPEIADAWLLLARCYWQSKRGEDARQACFNAINANANFKEAILFMAEITWPKNARVWRAMAEAADNSEVLFVRPTE